MKGSNPDLLTSEFPSVSLADIKEVELQNRLDFKFVFNRSSLPEILAHMKANYRILQINGIRLQFYDTQYFDDELFTLYHEHHNERSHRIKLRIRHYTSNNFCFAEIKRKFNTGRVVKRRESVSTINEQFPQDLLQESHTWTGKTFSDLNPSARIKFHRLTFVNNSNSERITLDLNLHVEDADGKIDFPQLVIAELKQYTKNSNGFGKIMRHFKVHTLSVSKYCLAISLLKNTVRKNNFKKVHLYLTKLQNQNLNGVRTI